MNDFDVSRARLLDKLKFKRFEVEEVRPFLTAVAENLVTLEPHLLVFERDDQTLALCMDQMTYHHVAQGEFAGEPFFEPPAIVGSV